MTEVSPGEIGEAIRRRGGVALARLASALDESVADAKKDLAEAARQLTRLRNELIGSRRAGQQVGDELDRINSILSAVVGQEYPLGGLRRQCVADARTALERLVTERS
jgi:hypothetical protein